MRLITISAEMLLEKSSFVFMKDAPALRAVEIIKDMNIIPYAEHKKTLTSIRNRAIEVIPAGGAATGKYRLEILLYGKRIYLDPAPQPDYNAESLASQNLYPHSEDGLYCDPSVAICVIQ